MRPRRSPTVFALLAAVAGCDGSAPPIDPPTTPHVFEDLLAALDISMPVGVYENWDNIPNPDLAAEIREYAEGTELVIECGSIDCTGPGHPISIGFREWSWSPPTAPLPVFDDPLGVYDSWERALEWFDPIMRNGDGVLVEVTTTDGGPLIAVEMTRTDEGEWVVGEVKQVGMVMF